MDRIVWRLPPQERVSVKLLYFKPWDLCEVAINPACAMVVYVDQLSFRSSYTFFHDGEEFSFVAEEDFQTSPLHGMAPRDTLVGSRGSAWRLCAIEALPLWKVEEVIKQSTSVKRFGCVRSCVLQKKTLVSTMEEFNQYEIVGCASCQPGFFSDGTGQTMCQECAEGRHTGTEHQTACEGCPQGASFVAKDVECDQCPPGTFLNHALMTACSPCEAGSFQHAAGQSGCYRCSAILGSQGPNPDLWTTMTRTERDGAWQEISGSLSVSDCGCGEGAWVDALGQCQECGDGIVCKGMGDVEVLPGYFAGTDSAGFVWRCHGADWARCPGGLPGVCARGRLNTSIACEQCEPFTRTTFDGPCQERCVVLLGWSLELPLRRQTSDSHDAPVRTALWRTPKLGNNCFFFF